MDGLLSRQQAATSLGVSLSTIVRLIMKGELPVVKVGDRSLVRPEDIAAYIARSTRHSPAAGA